MDKREDKKKDNSVTVLGRFGLGELEYRAEQKRANTSSSVSGCLVVSFALTETDLCNDVCVQYF